MCFFLQSFCLLGPVVFFFALGAFGGWLVVAMGVFFLGVLARSMRCSSCVCLCLFCLLMVLVVESCLFSDLTSLCIVAVAMLGHRLSKSETPTCHLATKGMAFRKTNNLGSVPQWVLFFFSWKKGSLMGFFFCFLLPMVCLAARCRSASNDPAFRSSKVGLLGCSIFGAMPVLIKGISDYHMHKSRT